MGKRVEYLDAMRCFGIVVVVMWHVYYYGYQNPLLNAYEQYFHSFFMPIFFLISGFLSYKTGVSAAIRISGTFVWRKFKALIIPTVAIAMVYIYMSDISLSSWFFNPFKNGYWFPLSLFVFFVMHSIYMQIDKLTGGGKLTDIMLVLFAIVMYMGCQFYFGRFIDEKIYGLLGIVNWSYYLFFVTGMLLRKHFATCERLLDGKLMSTILLILFFGFTVFMFRYMPSASTIVTGLFEMGSGVFGALAVFAFFRKYQDSFTSDKAFGRWTQYVGSRTLDIYLLHYFFVPRNLGGLGEWFTQYNNPAVEYAFTLCLSLVVIAICLVVSNVLRISPFLAHWLFGEKYAKR